MLNKIFNRITKYYFSKPPKQVAPQKGGKPAAAQSTTTSENNKLSKFIDIHLRLIPKPISLSPSQLNYMDNQFPDLTDEQKYILNQLALEISKLKQPTFYKLVDQGGLGTSQCFYTPTLQLDDQSAKIAIKQLRKD